mgnify:FL=1
MREKNYDLLRVVNCIMIVLLHAGAFFVSSEKNTEHVVGVVCQGMTRTAVPCFVMLSGAFLLSDERWRDYKFAVKKTYEKIVAPTILYTVFFVAFSCFTYWLGLTEASYKRVIELTICGYPYPHMWYMYMCIGLYLATPVIWKIKEGGENLGSIVLILIAGYMIQRSFQLIWPIKFIPFIGYFLFGNYVRQLNLEKTKNRKYIATGSFILWMVFITISCIGQIVETKNIWGVLPTDPLCPIVVIASLFCFVFFSTLDLKLDTYRLARHTESIYFIHIVVQQIIWTLGEKICPNLNVICKIGGIVCISMVMSLLYSNCLKKLRLMIVHGREI